MSKFSLCSSFFIAVFTVAVLANVSFAQPRGNPFGDGPPPAGTVSVMGRSMINTMYNGSSNSMFLMGAIDNENFRNQLGLSEDNLEALRKTRNEIGIEVMTKTAPLVERFKNMSGPEDQAAIQADLERAFNGYRERIEQTVPDDVLSKARTLNFQAMGGLDSPFLNMDMLKTLDLDDAQTEKAQKILKDMEAERAQQLEEGLALVEKAVSLGRNMSSEERKALEEEGRAMLSRTAALHRKLGDNLRTILTDAQKKKAENLMATRPSFLGPLPREMRGEGSDTDNTYQPGENSWQPGQGAPGTNRVIESVFPTGE